VRAASLVLKAACIVRIHYGHARRRIHRAVKQQPLGREILLHGLVIIQVVASQIREDGHIEVQPSARPWSSAWLETSVTNSVAPRSAPSAINSNKSLDSGVVCALGLTSPATWYSIVPTSTVLSLGRVQQRFGKEGRGGLAVGAGNARGGELRSG
jgi:hypothetical protein